MSLSRRNFLLASAAAAGATWFDVPQILADTRDESYKKYGGFPMGIQSYSLRAFGVDGAIEIIGKDLELHYVEFYSLHFKPTGDPAEIKAMKDKLAKYDISISAHGVQNFTKNHQANEDFFKFAKAAGIRNISANPSPDSFDSLDKLVKQYDIRIAIHNHGPGHRYDKPEDAMKAVANYDKRIGFCADLGHYIRSGFEPAPVIMKLKDRLYGVHFKDFAEMKKDAKGVIIGKGVMDVPATFKAMRAANFPADGALSLEYEESKESPVAEIQECLAIASEAARKVAAA